MSETITIESAELRKTKAGDEFLTVKATNGKKYSVWNKALWPLMVLGAMLDVEVETKGQYSNITDAKKSTAKPPEPAPQATERPSGGWGKDNASIEAQVAVKAVVEALVHQVEVPPDVIAGCWEWCRVRLPRVAVPISRLSKPAPGGRPVGDVEWDDLGAEPKRERLTAETFRGMLGSTLNLDVAGALRLLNAHLEKLGETPVVTFQEFVSRGHSLNDAWEIVKVGKGAA